MMGRKIMRKQFIFGLCAGVLSLSYNLHANEFDRVLACYNDENAPGTVIRIEQNNELIYSGAIGLANLDSKRKLDKNDVFQIGSVTKTFTAAAILTLAEQKKLFLHDSLSKFIPELNAIYGSVTLESVLSHTSGLPNYLTYPDVTAIWHKEAGIDVVVSAMSKQAVSGQSYSQYLAQTFFKPLAMKNTFVKTSGLHLPSVRGYTSHAETPKEYIPAELSKEREWEVDRSWIAGSGAIASTLTDMAIWQKALASGKVISNTLYQEMHTKTVLSNKQQLNYGYGINVYPIAGLASHNHEGMVPGFFSWQVHFPNEKIIATALTNLDKKHPGPALLDMISLHLGLTPERASGEKADKTIASLIGRYVSDEKELTIFERSGKLYSQYTGEQERVIVPRKNSAYSYECTENYFQLRESEGQKVLVPVHLYFGEQAPLIKQR